MSLEKVYDGKGNEHTLACECADLMVFRIDSTRHFLAEAGMTWRDWVDSQYNVDGYSCDSEGIYNEAGDPVSESDGTGAKPTMPADMIDPSFYYYT